MMMPGAPPGERLLVNKLGVGCTLASRLRIEGDEPVETVEEIRQVHRGAPKRRQFVRVSLISVTTHRQPESVESKCGAVTLG